MVVTDLGDGNLSPDSCGYHFNSCGGNPSPDGCDFAFNSVELNIIKSMFRKMKVQTPIEKK